MGEGFNRAIVVEHEETNTGSGEVVDGEIEGVFSLEVNWDITGSLDKEVSAVVDITEGVTANDDGFSPVLDESGDVVDEDGFSEDGTVEVVSDGSVGWFPHFLELELLDSGFVGGDGSTLNADLAVLDSFSSIEGHLVVSFISVLDAEIEVLDVEVKEGMDELILDLLPEDSGHFVTVEFSNGVVNFNFLGSKAIGEGWFANSWDGSGQHQIKSIQQIQRSI